MKQSINQLAVLTGFDRRTITRRLRPLTPEIDGKAHLYESLDALPLLFGGARHDGELLDLSQERAHLAREQTRVTELKRRQLEGELIPADIVLDRWSQIAATVRQRLLAIPTKVAGLAAHRSAGEVESIVKTEIYAVLTEFSELPRYTE